MFRAMSVAALTLFGSRQAHAIHYGCVTSPDVPKVLFMYENEAPPLSYVEKIANADGSDMYNLPIDVVYPSRKIIQSGYPEAQIDQASKKVIRVSDKNGEVVFEIPHINPNKYRMEDERTIKFGKDILFDGVKTRTLTYRFCGDD